MSEEIKNTTAETTNVNCACKKVWANRIWSALVGAAIAIGGMFGITNEQIYAEKTKAETLKSKAEAALDALKKGDVTMATASLQAAIATGNEIVVDAKEIAKSVKENESIVETTKNEIAKTVVADQAKKVEVATAMYTENINKDINKKK